MDENKLIQLINNISYKYSRTFTYNSRSTNGIFDFGNKLGLNKDYVYTLKLNSFSGWETLTNIDETKNKFQYSHDNGTNWNDITIPKGIWGFKQINKKMQEQMKNNNHYDSTNDKYYVNFEINTSENRIILNLQNNYQINFNVSNSMYNVFGFKKQKYTRTTQAPNNANISSSLSMFIIIDLIEPNILYSNGKIKFVQYVRSIPMYRNQISSRIVIEDINPQKYKLLESKYNVSSCRISLQDEDGKILDFGNEEFSIIFTIESS